MRLYLARHGETTWNVAGRYQGRLESDLSALGQTQALALADAMDGLRVERVVSSPLRRCSETARPSAERRGLPVDMDDRLLEIAHGSWEGRLRDEIAANDPERYRAWRRDPARVAFPGGETLAQVRDRWRAFLAAPGPEQTTLAVTHDAVVRVALLEASGRGLDDFWQTSVENGAYAVLDVAAGTATLVEACVTGHLSALRADTGRQAL